MVLFVACHMVGKQQLRWRLLVMDQMRDGSGMTRV